MVMISIKISPEQYEWKKKKGINWSYIIDKGIENLSSNTDMNELKKQLEELEKKQIRTAALLQHYATESLNTK